MDYYDEKFYDGNIPASLTSAKEIVPFMVKLVKPKSVVDIGCGMGTWLSVFKKSGCEVFGLDGNKASKKRLLIDKDEFLSKNLEKSFYNGKRYDLAMSLEVAEHLSEESANNFVSDIVKFSDTIVFSAAIPGQGGYNHINEQWQDYWVEKFEKKGYVAIDIIRKEFWDNKKVMYYYPQNMFILAKKNILNKNKKLNEAFLNTNRNMFSIVHPKIFSIKVNIVKKIKSFVPRSVVNLFNKIT